jgi:hypothetical protein
MSALSHFGTFVHTAHVLGASCCTDVSDSRALERVRAGRGRTQPVATRTVSPVPALTAHHLLTQAVWFEWQVQLQQVQTPPPASLSSSPVSVRMTCLFSRSDCDLLDLLPAERAVLRASSFCMCLSFALMLVYAAGGPGDGSDIASAARRR